jgi:predicted DNA-binding transcriptional regulator AlpA
MLKNQHRHHLDCRAHVLVERGEGPADELLRTREVAAWLGISVPWLEIARSRGFGPAFVRVSARCVRYRRGDVLKWLLERTHAGTAEYSAGGAHAA